MGIMVDRGWLELNWEKLKHILVMTSVAQNQAATQVDTEFRLANLETQKLEQ